LKPDGPVSSEVLRRLPIDLGGDDDHGDLRMGRLECVQCSRPDMTGDGQIEQHGIGRRRPHDRQGLRTSMAVLMSYPKLPDDVREDVEDVSLVIDDPKIRPGRPSITPRRPPEYRVNRGPSRRGDGGRPR